MTEVSATLPGAIVVTEGVRWVAGTNRGYRHPGNKPMVTWHTTETKVMSRSAIAGHRHPPHLWTDPDTGIVHQTIPLDQPALALLNAGVETNHRGPNIQIEVFGYAAEAHSWSDVRLANLADVLARIDAWMVGEYGEGVLSGDVATFHRSGQGIILASPQAPQRMSEAEWFAFHGSVGHQHAPGNDHWDPGGLNVARIHQLAASNTGETIMARAEASLDKVQVTGPGRIQVWGWTGTDSKRVAIKVDDGKGNGLKIPKGIAFVAADQRSDLPANGRSFNITADVPVLSGKVTVSMTTLDGDRWLAPRYGVSPTVVELDPLPATPPTSTVDVARLRQYLTSIDNDLTRARSLI